MVSPPRVMIDTTIIIAGSGWPRWPYEVLQAGVRGDVQLVLCPYVLEQARRVLHRRLPALVPRFEEFLAEAALELVADPSPTEVSSHEGLVRDRTDLPIVLAALNANVDYLVSEDKDLTAHDATTARLRELLAVRLSGTFLREVLGWSSESLEAVRKRSWGDLETELPGEEGAL